MHLLMSPLVKEFWKSDIIWRIYWQACMKSCDKTTDRHIEVFCDATTCHSQCTKWNTLIHENTNFILMFQLDLCTPTKHISAAKTASKMHAWLGFCFTGLSSTVTIGRVKPGPPQISKIECLVIIVKRFLQAGCFSRCPTMLKH